MYLNSQIHDTQDTLMIHVEYMYMYRCTHFQCCITMHLWVECMHLNALECVRMRVRQNATRDRKHLMCGGIQMHLKCNSCRMQRTVRMRQPMRKNASASECNVSTEHAPYVWYMCGGIQMHLNETHVHVECSTQ